MNLGERIPGPLRGAAYALAQATRVSGYLSQMILGNVLLGRRPTDQEKKQLAPPSLVLTELKRLFARDWANVQAGIYKLPLDHAENPWRFSRDTWRVFTDLARVRRRSVRREVTDFAPEVPHENYPPYYAQNFHFQTDGYLSEESADRYDHQVELVFGGGADAMRRQCLVPLRDHFSRRAPTGETALLDVACGTGRFLGAVKDNYPELHVTGVDLSPWYLKKARRNLERRLRADFIEGNAESLVFRDARFDVVTCLFLFHELPRRVRARVAAEIFRVLKPGGIFIFEDSIQLGDRPGFDGSLELFPKHYHEPYYADYIGHDLRETFESAGFTWESCELAFFSKVVTLRRRG